MIPLNQKEGMDEILGIVNLFKGRIISINGVKITGEDIMSFEQLSNYKPEIPKDGGFEPFKYDGPAIIEKSMISVNTKIDSEFYPSGCNQIEIAAIIMDGDMTGRKLFKRFNLDDETEDKSGKTSLKKLADQFWAVGLTFKNLEELKEINEKFVGMTVHVKAWPADFKDGSGPRQMWNIKGKEKSVAGTAKKPSF